MTTYSTIARSLNPRQTVQTEVIPGRTDMVENNAGGFVFSTGIWTGLDRFLILGAEGSTYYVSQRKLAKDNADVVMQCIREDGVRVVNRIVEISSSARAPKNDPALFALALVLSFGDENARAYAGERMSQVARIGTHVLHLAEYVNSLRGWGRGIRRAFSNWYLSQSPKGLAMNLVKYANRDGWTHRDILRLAHPKAVGTTHQQLLAYAAGKPYAFAGTDVAPFMDAVARIKNTTSARDAVKIIADNNLPREVIPTELLTDAAVWEALLPHMGMTAMTRNLATMTRVGLLTSTSDATKLVLAKLQDLEEMKRSKIHPIQFLAALLTYNQGHGMRGTNTWTPVTKIVDGLDEAFYASFDTVIPTGKKVVYGLDLSASMTWSNVAGVPGLTPRVASVTLAMLAARTEKDSVFTGFSSIRDGHPGLTELDITSRHRLDTVCHTINKMYAGSTDCALPMLWAAEKNIEADAFVILTDSETWAGTIHPTQALAKYRKQFNNDAALIVVGMTATEFTIADPTDPRQLDVVGFDTATPNLISGFIRGEF